MKNDLKIRTHFPIVPGRIYMIILFSLLFVILSECNPANSRKSSKSNLAQEDSAKANLIDPELLFKRAESFYKANRLSDADKTLTQIVIYYERPQDSLISFKALRFLKKVQDAIAYNKYMGENDKTENSTLKYVVNTDIIFAATSEANYDLMINCIVSGDKQAVGTMVQNGQVKYLYKNTVVYLVKAKFKCYVVRPEGSTELVYVVGEQLSKTQ